MAKEKWKLTTEEKREVVRLYVRGKSPADIAREFGITSSSVQYHITKCGEKTPTIDPNNQYQVSLQRSIENMEERLTSTTITQEQRSIITETLHNYRNSLHLPKNIVKIIK